MVQRHRLRRNLHGELEEHGVKATQDEGTKKDGNDAKKDGFHGAHRGVHGDSSEWERDVLRYLVLVEKGILSRVCGTCESVDELGSSRCRDENM